MWRSQGEAPVTYIGVREGGGRVNERDDIERGEVARPIKNLKCGKQET